MENDTLLIYFVQMGNDGPIKIGRTRSRASLVTRLRAIQISSAEPIFLRAVLPGGADTEAKIHGEFDAARLRGEWFQPTDELLTRVAEIGSPDGLPTTTRVKLDARMPIDEARAIWLDKELSVNVAISRMPGWHVKSAHAEIGPRPYRDLNAPAHVAKQREHGRKGGAMVRAESPVFKWTSEEWREKREDLAPYWRDPKLTWERARDRIAKKEPEFKGLSYSSMWRIFDARKVKPDADET